MSDAIGRLAERVGVEQEYLALDGSVKRVPESAKLGVLRAMGIAVAREADAEALLKTAPYPEIGGMHAPEGARCFLPGWLKEGRCFGINCQLYGLRSARNHGVGDFSDLALLGEIGAAAGADFVGVNPLHALFLAAPERCSPFFPSSRQFLNPLYIALDAAPYAKSLGEALAPPADLKVGDLIPYREVGAFKARALRRLFRIFRSRASRRLADDFGAFCVQGGQPLYLHALFETISASMVADGGFAGWHGWPEEFRHPANDAVAAFAREEPESVAYHSWLQWLADRQLGEAQARARAAGMRIGLYLDLAVGVAPDGSATWSDRELVVPGARIGAPPDYFNAAGQDWGLAPLSPRGLAARDFAPYRESLSAVLRHAGALRIDHAMSLYRLFWIADGLGAAEGAYVRYPFERMLGALAAVSQERQAIVIGEDLGVVPPGFREVMREIEMQSYRVFFFEKRGGDHFIPPEDYPREALACATTHDLHTLAGWWSGDDLATRAKIGMIGGDALVEARAERAHERRRMLGLLHERGLLPSGLEATMRAEAEPPHDLPADLATALYRLIARAPSRLVTAPAEDLVGTPEQVNIPGTTDEHPNWRRRLPVGLEDLPQDPLFQAITAALRDERPKG
jgi:4-alpha-glucanotransferase